MATVSYESALAMAESLSQGEQLRLIEDLKVRASKGDSPKAPYHSIMELCGLGKEVWEGIDAQEYVNNERASWNG